MIFYRAYMIFYEGKILQSNKSDYSIWYKYDLHVNVNSTNLSCVASWAKTTNLSSAGADTGYLERGINSNMRVKCARKFRPRPKLPDHTPN